MEDASIVGGALRLSVPYEGANKKTVFTTIESSFSISSEENSTESRNQARDKAWEELVADIEKRISEVINPIMEDLESL